MDENKLEIYTRAYVESLAGLADLYTRAANEGRCKDGGKDAVCMIAASAITAAVSLLQHHARLTDNLDHTPLVNEAELTALLVKTIQSYNGAIVAMQPIEEELMAEFKV